MICNNFNQNRLYDTGTKCWIMINSEQKDYLETTGLEEKHSVDQSAISHAEWEVPRGQ